MKIVRIQINDDFGEIIERYMLLDSNGKPVVPVVKYLKYLDNIGKKQSTLWNYCNRLKFYFEFLEQSQLTYEDVDIKVLVKFVAWLRKSNRSVKVTEMLSRGQKASKKRTNSSINTIVSAVMNFYDYVILLDDFESDLRAKTIKKVSGKYRTFKPFLHHISKDKDVEKNALTLPIPKTKPKILSQNQVRSVVEACTNKRDVLLFRILYETGARISEALGMRFEDFNIAKREIIISKSKTTAGEGRTVYVTAATMNLFQDYVNELIIDDEFDNNYVFVTLKGENKGERLKYPTVYAMVQNIKQKTKIDFNPHMFRHTFATELLEKGAEVKVVQELLGHEHVQTTMQTYTHLSKDKIRKEYQKRYENNNGEIRG